MAAPREICATSNDEGGQRGQKIVHGSAVAVVVSLLVHAGALAWVASDRDASIVVAMDAAPPLSAADPPDTLEVTFFEYAPSSSSTTTTSTSTSTSTGTSRSASAAAPSRARAGAQGRISTGVAAGELPGGDDEPPARSPWMTMRRGGEEPLKGLSESFWAKFAENTKPLPPAPDIPGERVANELAELRAKLRRAGRYSPEELAAMRAELVALNDAREREELKPAGGGTYKTEKETFRAKIHADGSVKLEDRPENMDTQDKMMLRHGIDPYARNKLAYLDRTREQRVAIGKRHREQELKKSVVYMQQHVVRLLATTADEAKRKEGLFELWDECSETGTPEEIAGGAAARAFVMAHIRATVRYTPDELRRLNAARMSKQEFVP